ncbi:MAG: hypothetical protein NTY48_01175 [Candidatus Diapherotrites archaeon]|nr:hypothetical protein [Candidatus Diapherotrites archaeon]
MTSFVKYFNVSSQFFLMKKACFVEFEGVLAPSGAYSPSREKANKFLADLAKFCSKESIELFLVSGRHFIVAKPLIVEMGFEKFFDDSHFLCVDDNYISSKHEMDKLRHKESISKDPFFADTYFKQVAIINILDKNNFNPKGALLLSDDIWVDGYYSMRFSKIDFAILEDNILDRGKPACKIEGLAYFSLDFSVVRPLLTNFPDIDYSGLDKYVFESMKHALVGDSFSDAVKNSFIKKNFRG